MKPADALRLPCARVTDEQRKHVAHGLQVLEEGFPKAMSRGGMSFDLNGDPVVIGELARLCALDGWLTRVETDMEPSRTQPGKMFLRGFKLILTPPPAAYAEADAEIAKEALS